ncbi:hypothetical protein ACFPM0_10720 [Pseudonocardia sulfidoxydans]|uniref:hypothetical protein n=1 Tax=Pseudonocardia sulfidoxydans TaxID=54011 RepID=UPI0036218A08
MRRPAGWRAEREGPAEVMGAIVRARADARARPPDPCGQPRRGPLAGRTMWMNRNTRGRSHQSCRGALLGCEGDVRPARDGRPRTRRRNGYRITGSGSRAS